MKPWNWVLAVAWGVSFAGCGVQVIEITPAPCPTPTLQDAGPVVTNTPPPPMSRPDAGSMVMPLLDAGRPDAGTVGTGIVDAGFLDTPPVNAGEPDAGAPDAGGDQDAGVFDEDAPGIVSEYPIVPNQGGPRLMHPQVVSITYPDDTLAAGDATLVRYLVTGAWLQDVGGEYGIGTGTVLGTVQRSTMSPAAISSDDIANGLIVDIRSGALPSPPGGDFSNTLYMFFFPATTTVAFTDPEETAYSCVAFGGYHDSVMSSFGRIAYAVVVECEDSDQGLDVNAFTQVAASHEFIEAATDADPLNQPAYQLPPGEGEPYSEWGPEIGDMCLNDNVVMDGYTLQQVWSNRVAAMGTTFPCVPGTPLGGGP